MKPNKRQIGFIAKSYKIDPDELILTLWNNNGNRFEYLSSASSIIKKTDNLKIKEIIRIKNDKTLIKKIEYVPPTKYKNFDFDSIGKHVPNIECISRDEILHIYKILVDDYSKTIDPIYPAGVKDENVLYSALMHQTTSLQGVKKYKSIETSSAALMYALTSNHAFHNGNKRTALVTTLVFLDKYNIDLTCKEDDLILISYRLAQHAISSDKSIMNLYDAEVFELSKWISKNSRHREKGERNITLRRLKQILAKFGCTFSDGKFEREISSKGIFGIKIKKTPKQYPISPTMVDGNEISKKSIREIRDLFNLTEEYSIDSKTFYEDIEFTTSEFIIKYKNTLNRLAKM